MALVDTRLGKEPSARRNRRRFGSRGRDDGSPTLTQFHALSFEGPDAYARAGGIASRISGLTKAIAEAGFETHLWFVGDPEAPGHETHDRLTLHRWCQWISRYHPGGVYDGEMGKVHDYSASLPPYQLGETLLPHLRSGGRAVVLAEEWHTVGAVFHLHELLERAGLRSRVQILWNANNLFGFDGIDWPRLSRSAIITTVSRYMRYRMWDRGVDALVIPNGLGPDAFAPAPPRAVDELQERLRGRFVMSKMARWDPDKRWLLAVDIVSDLKRRGWKPLLIARGGVEAHGGEVLERARAAGLRVVDRSPEPGTGRFLESLQGLEEVDVVNVCSHVFAEPRRVLFEGSSTVLANSGHEPFGLVGLETMAARGIACTGGTGEDYVQAGWNALVVQSDDPGEFVRQAARLRSDAGEERALRRRAWATARRFAWGEVVRRGLLPAVGVPRPARERVSPTQSTEGVSAN